MPSKTTAQSQKQQQEETTPRGAALPEELWVAYQVHTLAHMIYDQMTARSPWGTQIGVTRPAAPAREPFPAYGAAAAGWAQNWPSPWDQPIRGW